MPMGPSRLEQVRNRGKHLNKEIQKEARLQISSTPSVVSVPRKKHSMPSYNIPAKALRAAQAAMAELASLAGEAREKQQARVNELVQIAAWLNDRPPRHQKEVGEEEGVYSVKPAEHRSHGQASSPHVHRDRAPSVNSGRVQKAPGYDRAAAGKQKAQDSEEPRQPQHSRSRAREPRQYSHHESRH